MSNATTNRKATLTLTSYSCESAMDGEADFDAWTSYVAARIDERTGLDVTVDQTAWRNPGAFEDIIECQCDATDASCSCAADIREALRVLWDEFCADSSAWPAREEPKPWTFDGYWNTVLGAIRSAADVVREFELDASDRVGLGTWLGEAEDAARSAGGLSTCPAAWAEHHTRALDALCAAEVAS